MVKRKTFIKQYLKRIKDLLERYLPEEDEEAEMIKITKLVATGEIRHIDDVVTGKKGGCMRKVKLLFGFVALAVFMAVSFSVHAGPIGGNRLIYGWDGTEVQMIKTNSSGEMQIGVTAAGAVLVRKESSQDLSAAALSYTTNFAAKTKIKAIMLSASVNITETATFSFNSATGASYDTTIASEGLTAEKNYLYTPEGELCLLSGDEITVTCTNANATGTVYITVMGETLN